MACPWIAHKQNSQKPKHNCQNPISSLNPGRIPMEKKQEHGITHNANTTQNLIFQIKSLIMNQTKTQHQIALKKQKQPEKTNPNKDITNEKKLKLILKQERLLIQKIKKSKKVTNFRN